MNFAAYLLGVLLLLLGITLLSVLLSQAFASNERSYSPFQRETEEISTSDRKKESERLKKQFEIFMKILAECQGDTSTEGFENLTDEQKIQALVRRYQQMMDDLKLRLITHKK